MEKLTKEQAIIVSGYTMVLMCDFSELHEDIERRLGRPVWTHQLPGLKEEIKEAYKDDFCQFVLLVWLVMKNIDEQSIAEFAELCVAVVALGIAMAYIFNGMADWMVGL